ncbi:hypothetical protein [Streptomyces sp. NPDC059781]|uniref:hypothetical protein n=1 Tax=Streptomyces sp. NPDC059781 TaxID=3346943 RepID=UPI00365F035F
MTDLIGRLAAWVNLLFCPRGAHRRNGPRPEPSFAPRPAAASIPLPSHRSPYGLDTLLDGAAIVAVRPYVTASWFQERQAA